VKNAALLCSTLRTTAKCSDSVNNVLDFYYRGFCFIFNFNIAQIVMDRAGCIMSADSETAVIFQYEEDDLEEADIAALIPAIKLPGSDEALTKVI
jgi:hypothetical protein